MQLLKNRYIFANEIATLNVQLKFNLMVSKERKLISRADAAKRLGVSQATVINYSELGFIKETVAGGRYLVDLKSVESLMSTQQEIEEMRKRFIGDNGHILERLKKEVSDKENTLKEKKQQLANKELELDYAIEQFRNVLDLPKTIVKKKFTIELLKHLIVLGSGKQIKPKHQTILECYIKGEPLNDIAEHVSMTLGGIREVLTQMIRSLESLMTYPELEKRITTLEDSNAILENENERLQETIKKMADGEKVRLDSVGQKSERALNMMSIEDPQLGLSIRTVNALGANSVRTVGELRKYTYRQMINFRGMGKKSLDDVSKCLEKFGIRISCAPE